MDGDGIGDLCDPDIDGDGVANVQEVIDQTKPYDNCDYLDSSITLVISGAFDCDQDGVRDDIDLDDDNDGILDTEETQDDLDSNGKGNSLDLDSDGDGCFDVIEAGFEDPDQDGILGTSPVEVDALGMVTSSIGYSLPLDRDNSGQSDYLELPLSSNIILQPSSTAEVIPDQNSILSVDLDAGDTFDFQWQILKDTNDDWEDLTASNSFQGVTTKNLTLINPQESWVGWKLRVAISSRNYPCDPFVFSEETEIIYQSLYIPNAFSPNNDGVNENWIIEGLAQFPEHQLTVYSRWETLILKESPYSNDWSGEIRASYSNSNGQNAPEGTYFYILELGNGHPPVKGFIYLKR